MPYSAKLLLRKSTIGKGKGVQTFVWPDHFARRNGPSPAAAARRSPLAALRSSSPAAAATAAAASGRDGD